MNILRALFLILCTSTLLSAQQAATRPAKRSRCLSCAQRIIKPPAKTEPDFYVGEARVNVAKDQTVIRLAMAQHGSVLIEVPVDDGPRFIIPGDPEMATVDQKALERNKRAIIVRPGSSFIPPARNARSRMPAATVTAQMRSGLVVTFLFYPVGDLAQNVHRCVLSYRRDEVVASRRAAGLPVNLDVESKEEGTEQPAASAISIEGLPSEKVSERAVETKTQLDTNPELPKPIGSAQTSESISTSASTEKPAEPMQFAFVRERLQQAISQRRGFERWTKAVNGIRLSQFEGQDAVDAYSLAIIAVRNTTSKDVTLTPGSPELFIEMVNDDGQPVNIETLKYLHLEQSDSSRTIKSQGTIYFGIVYASPLLGTHQRIKFSVAHSRAVDGPASIILSNHK